MRFNPPPGWPTPPPGWEPPKGWQPDPTWQPAPADWVWWVPDAPVAAPPPPLAPPLAPPPAAAPAPTVAAPTAGDTVVVPAAAGAADASHAQASQRLEPTATAIALLGQLADLHKAGVLTDDEFAAKKAHILSLMS